jgi:magnesium transporter
VLSSIMQPANRIINTHTSLDDVTYQFRHYALVSLPVVNAAGQLAGVITVDDVVEVIEEQAEENTMRLGGLSSLDFYRASWITARNRFTWLFVNLLTAVLASWVISFFTKSIEQVVALAVLMPIVASMGGNAGTQTVTVTVRALALRQLKANNRMRFITKESVVGLMNGGLFALLAAVFCGVWFDNFKLGLVMGTLIPLGLKRLGFDPAVSTTVFLTTVTDVVGYVAFLGLATWVLL